MSTESANPSEGRLGYVLKQAQHGLRIRMDNALAATGLTTPQYSTLCCVVAEPGISNAALARRVFLTPQTTQGIIAILERDGLVARAADESHGRILCTKLTAKGRKVLDKSHGAVSKIESELVAGISEDETQLLIELLRRCVKNMRSE